MLRADLVVRMQSACAAGNILVFYLAFIPDFCENELFRRIKQKLISPYCLEEGIQTIAPPSTFFNWTVILQ